MQTSLNSCVNADLCDSPLTIMKSLRGTCLDNPVVDTKPLDSTRLKHKFEKARDSPNRPKQIHASSVLYFRSSYSSALRTGLRVGEPKQANPEDSASPLIETIPKVEDGWEEVRYRRSNSKVLLDSVSILFSSPASSISNNKTDQSRRSLPTKSKSWVGKQKLSVCEKSVKKPPGAKVSNLVVVSRNDLGMDPNRCASRRNTLPKYLQQAKQDDLEVWWTILGFTNQRRPVKQEKFVKALYAVGFTLRNQNGAQVTYNPPASLREANAYGRALTLHLPHGTNIEKVELKNKGKTIKKLYPSLVDTMRELWRGQ
ncbi:unnamed protein product [Rhizoctonia solani]|uniref:Uncharacterized protein n=1 Tax=Rhizoctonia solani TaxID=456999 RepID=A0A8H3AVQ2_9AGAM|nr:unnamed protein product [Rhizoctonia solani]